MESLAVYLKDIVNRQKEYLSKEEEMIYPTGWTPPKGMQEKRNLFVKISREVIELNKQKNSLLEEIKAHELGRNQDTEIIAICNKPTEEIVDEKGNKSIYQILLKYYGRGESISKDGKKELKEKYNIPQTFWDSSNFVKKVSSYWKVSGQPAKIK